MTELNIDSRAFASSVGCILSKLTDTPFALPRSVAGRMEGPGPFVFERLLLLLHQPGGVVHHRRYSFLSPRLLPLGPS